MVNQRVSRVSRSEQFLLDSKLYLIKFGLARPVKNQPVLRPIVEVVDAAQQVVH